MANIRLEKYKQFLNAFSYALVELKEDCHFSGGEEFIHFQIFMLPKEAREIKDIYIKLPLLIDEAKNELLNNLYSINRLIDKRHFLTLITSDFIQIYKASFTIYRAVEEGIINIFDYRMEMDFFYKYISIIYSEYYIQWRDFLSSICKIYNINLIEDKSMLAPDDKEDILGLYQILYAK